MALSEKANTEYLEEVTIQLRAHGFTVHPLESRDIDAAHDGKPLCRVNSFITWDWTHNRTSLWQGHYYGPHGLTGSCEKAKRDFVVRSGLLPASALFTQEQLTEVYRSIHETLDGDIPLTDERRKALESAAGQIEEGVPDLKERVSVSVDRERELSLQLDRANMLEGMGGVSL